MLSQKEFTIELLKGSGLNCSKTVSIALPQNCKLELDQGDLLTDPIYYRALVGKLNFLTHTRPNLSFTTQTLSQFMQKTMTSHLQALHHTLRYI